MNLRKSHRTSISWLIRSKSNPLRWASVWFRCWSEAAVIHSVAMLRKRRRNGRGNCHHGKQRSGRFLPFAAIEAGVSRFSLPSKFLLYPVGSLCQASVPRMVHAGFPFGIRKNALNFLFCPFLHVPVFRCGPEILRHLHIALPGMAHDCLFTLAFCVHQAVLAPTASALAFPAAFAVGVGIVQGLIFGTDHIVESFIVNIIISRGDCRLLPWAGLWRKPSSVVSGISV